MKQWMISFGLFIAVFVCCIVTILSPIKFETELYGTSPPVLEGASIEAERLDGITLTYTDIRAMGQNWRHNPNYFITIGMTAVLALAGAWWSLRNMAKRETEDEKTNI